MGHHNSEVPHCVSMSRRHQKVYTVSFLNTDLGLDYTIFIGNHRKLYVFLLLFLHKLLMGYSTLHYMLESQKNDKFVLGFKHRLSFSALHTTRVIRSHEEVIYDSVSFHPKNKGASLQTLKLKC